MTELTKTIFMPRHIHEKWDAALRSGEYKQGKGMLFCEEDNAFCCLGVLQHCVSGPQTQDLVGQLGHPSEQWLKDHGIEFYNFDANGRRFSFVNPSDGDRTNRHSLTTWNDSLKKSFEKIADRIALIVQYTDEEESHG